MSPDHNVAAIKLNLKPIAGYCYGSTQKSCVGYIFIRTFSHAYIGRITPLLKEYFSAEFFENIEKAPIKNELDLLTCFVRLAVEIQRKYGIPSSDQGIFIKKIASVPGGGRFLVALPYCNLAALEQTLRWLVDFFDASSKACFSKEDEDLICKAFLELAATLKRLANSGQNYPYIIEAAVQLQLPILRDSPGWTRIGLGSKCTDFFSSITMYTSSIGVRLAKDKLLTGVILKEMGLPCPENAIAKDELAACEIANKMGYPVVIKPVDQDAGLGVSADICSDDMVRIAYQHASKYSKSIMVEKHIDGFGHRLLVVRGKVVKVTKKLPWGVVGDGKSSIEQLVKLDLDDRYKKEALKGKVTSTDSFPSLDDESIGLLTQYGLNPKHILESQRFFALKRKNNASSGGSTEIIPIERVHLDNINLCTRVASLFGLDICGVDLILPSIEQSWLEGDVIICDVNAQPQTDSQTVAVILEEMIEDGGRLPMHLLLYEEAALSIVELDQYLKKISKKLGCNGTSTRHNIFINEFKVAINLHSGFHAARILVHDRQLLSGLCAIPFRELLKFGLPIDRFETIRILRAGAGKLCEDSAPVDELDPKTYLQILSMIKPHTCNLIMEDLTSARAN